MRYFFRTKIDQTNVSVNKSSITSDVNNGMKFVNAVFLLLGSLIFVACTSKYIITSDPSEAKVSMSTQQGTKKIDLGLTPLEIPSREVLEKLELDPSSGEYFFMTVSKSGFKEEKLLVPVNSTGVVKTKVFAHLSNFTDSRDIAGQMVQHLFNAQQFAQNGNYDKAHDEIDKSLQLDERFTRALSMKASIYYLQGRYGDSLVWYEKALSIDPKFGEALKMITAVRAKAGDKK